MIIEISTIVLTAIIWILSMIHMYRGGFIKGHYDGARSGTIAALNTLEEHGILTDEGYEEVLKAIRAKNSKDIPK